MKMHCFTTHKKKKVPVVQEPTMSRTLSAPASYGTSNIAMQGSPVVHKQEHNGSMSPLITHSGGGYNSLSGLRRDSAFRGQPLPLPTPESCGVSSAIGFMPSPLSKSNLANCSSPRLDTSSVPLPRPPAVVERLSSAHISFAPDTACIGESGNGPAFTCTVSIDSPQSSTQAVLIRLADTTMQDTKAWIEHVKEIACMRDVHLSRILGFSFTTDEKLVVYELQPNGSLDKLLYGRASHTPPLNWQTRVRIATHAARGLAFLHERSPNKLMYKDFRTFNIHLDKDFRARLMGYGFTPRSLDIARSPMVAAYAAPELVTGQAHASTKSNVWSFGVVLLEILTGRQNREEMFPEREQDLVKWTAPYLNNESKLFLVVDPELKGMFPARSVALFAKLASQCVQTDPVVRPTMDEVVQSLERTQETEQKTSSCSDDSQKPLIEALKECTSPVKTLARDESMQKKVVSRLVKTLCSSTEVFD